MLQPVWNLELLLFHLVWNQNHFYSTRVRGSVYWWPEEEHRNVMADHYNLFNKSVRYYFYHIYYLFGYVSPYASFYASASLNPWTIFVPLSMKQEPFLLNPSARLSALVTRGGAQERDDWPLQPHTDASATRLHGGSVADPDPGSGIGCLVDPWIRDPGWVESQHPDPGSAMNNPDHIF